MKEELKSVATEFGELFGVQTGTALMPKLFVNNWDYTNHTQVGIICNGATNVSNHKLE